MNEPQCIQTIWVSFGYLVLSRYVACIIHRKADGLQANHRFQVNLQRRIYSHATDVEIRPLNEEKAVQAATDFLGEAFIFSVRA